MRVRPGKGIHVVLDRRLTNYGILSEAIDGRQIFLEPWQNVSILGTTDDDYYGDLDDVRATSEEVRYLVQGVARVFPSVRTARAIGTYAGVRATLYAYGKPEDALSREHEIVDHAADGSPGVYSMIGGKLASYRIFSQEMSRPRGAQGLRHLGAVRDPHASFARRRAGPRRPRPGRQARHHAGRGAARSSTGTAAAPCASSSASSATRPSAT